MEIKRNIRKIAELGIGLTAVSALILAGCGGGGGGSAASSSLTITPVKGIFSGTCNVSIANTAGTVYSNASQTIGANGTVSVPVPAAAAGIPLVISISGNAAGTCKYFNDSAAAPAWITMGTTSSLNALVTSAQVVANANIAVTALTEMAFQAASAVNGGNVTGLSDTSTAIKSGNAAAVALAGLAAGTSIFTPPAVIPASGVAGSTDATTTALVNIANMNPANPIVAIQNLSYQAVTAASSVAVVPTALPMTPAPANTFATTVANNAASAVAAVTTVNTTATNTTNTSSFLAAVTSAAGLRNFFLGQTGTWLGGGTANQPATGMTIKATGTSSYSVSTTKKILQTGTWSAAPVGTNGYLLTNAAGWVEEGQETTTASMNPDGTSHLVQDGKGTSDATITAVPLAGTTFASVIGQMVAQQALQNTNISGVPATVGVNANLQIALTAGVPSGATVATPVPTGSWTAGMMYQMANLPSAVTSQDIYELWNPQIQPTGLDNNVAYSVGTAIPISAMSGLGLTAMCLQGAYVTNGVTAGTFDVYPSGTAATATSACTAPATLGTPSGTLTVTKSTANLQPVAVISASTVPGINVNTVLGFVNGAVRVGRFTPKGTLMSVYNGGNGNNAMFDDTAAKQFFTAAPGGVGAPLF